MNIDDMNVVIGRRIMDARKTAGLTQKELGARIGISGQMVYKYERGGRVYADIVCKIAAVLGISPMSLLTDAADVNATLLDVTNPSGHVIGHYCIGGDSRAAHTLCIEADQEAAGGVIEPYDLCLIDTQACIAPGRSIVAVKDHQTGNVHFLWLTVISDGRAIYDDGQKSYTCTDGVSEDGRFYLIGRVYQVIRKY